MSKRDLLIEIGTEEIPAQLVAPAAKQFVHKLTEWLNEQRIDFEKTDWYGTPRRFAAVIYGVQKKQRESDEILRGPAKRIAMTEAGEWTKAAIGFARSQGVSTEDLFFRKHKGEAYVFARKKQAGKATMALLQRELKPIITSLSFPKSMRWGNHEFRFVRPIHWLVALYGSEVIPLEIAGVKSGNVTQGHRFLGGETAVAQAADYVETLRRQYVLVSPDERRKQIREQLKHIADTNDWVIPVDPALLEEVTYLVEYPTATFGKFDQVFLEIPDEVLMTSMRAHQRYFPVKSRADKLLPYFVTVRNGDDTSIDQVAKGNEKVLRARLADARFFYREDQKRPLSFFKEKLAHVVFHEKLGTIADKVRRIRSIAATLAQNLGLDEEVQREIDRTAELCKCDLGTLMVDEFPELQGYMGEEYARLAGENSEVAKGISEHYLPRSAGDQLPVTETGLVVGLADKIDTIVACFTVGIIPTGSTDPYALRRQAAGIVQVILGRDVHLSLQQLFAPALDEWEGGALPEGALSRKDVELELERFFRQRLKYVLQNENVRHDVLAAVLHSDTSHLQLTVSKAIYLMKQVDDESFKNTVEAFTRVENLASKAEELLEFDETLNEEQAEKHLAAIYRDARQRYNAAEQNNQVELMYEAIASMAPAIHTYFEEVMVMADDTSLRNNRLALLQAISVLIRRFAHFNEIVIP